MDTALNYKLREKEAAERVEQFASAADPSDLKHDIALLRYLVEEATNTKSAHLASCLLTTLGRLVRVHDRRQLERNELLAKAVVLRLAERIVQTVARQFYGALPDWQQRIDAALVEITNEVEAAENPKELLPPP